MTSVVSRSVGWALECFSVARDVPTDRVGSTSVDMVPETVLAATATALMAQSRTSSPPSDLESRNCRAVLNDLAEFLTRWNTPIQKQAADSARRSSSKSDEVSLFHINSVMAVAIEHICCSLPELSTRHRISYKKGSPTEIKQRYKLGTLNDSDNYDTAII